MKDLLKDYLENSPEPKFVNVVIYSFDKDSFSVTIKFTHTHNGETKDGLTQVDVWNLLAYVNSKIK